MITAREVAKSIVHRTNALVKDTDTIEDALIYYADHVVKNIARGGLTPAKRDEWLRENEATGV